MSCTARRHRRRAGGVVCTGASVSDACCEDTFIHGRRWTRPRAHRVPEPLHRNADERTIYFTRSFIYSLCSHTLLLSLSLVSQCEMLVFYPQERQGTCVLCADLAVRVLFSLFARARMHTPIALTLLSLLSPTELLHLLPRDHPCLRHNCRPSTTRRPTRGRASLLPVDKLRGDTRHQVSLPPRPLSHLGRHHTKQHFECHYQPQTEYSVDQSTGYTDRKSDSTRSAVF